MVFGPTRYWSFRLVGQDYIPPGADAFYACAPVAPVKAGHLAAPRSGVALMGAYAGARHWRGFGTVFAVLRCSIGCDAWWPMNRYFVKGT